MLSLLIEIVRLFLGLDELLEFSVEAEISECINLVELSGLFVLLVDLLSSQSLVELSDRCDVVSDDLIKLHFVPGGFICVIFLLIY